MTVLVEMRQDMAKLVENLESLHKQAAGEKRSFDESEQREWDRMSEEHARLTGLIAQREALEDEENPERQTQGGGEQKRTAPTGEEYRDAFWSYFKRPGRASTPQSVMDQLAKGYVAAEGRGVVVNTDVLGAYTVPEGAMQPLIEAEKFVGGMVEAGITIVPTATGTSLPVPMIDDTASTGETAEELTDATEGSLAFQKNELNAYMRDSEYIKVSYKFLRDTSLPLFKSWLLNLLGKRLFRKRNEEWTNGLGTNAPLGVVPASTSGVTAASATEVTYGELLELYIAVDRAYRRNGVWMFNDTTYGEILDLKDNSARHYFIDQNGTPMEKILGKRVVINSDMPDSTTGLKAVLYGDFSYYWGRVVGGPRLSRTDERFWEAQASAFMAVEEWDGLLMDAGQHPIKAITMG